MNYLSRNILVRRIIRKKLTYLDLKALLNIDSTIRYVEDNLIEGKFVEAGCALGGSSILITKAKNSKRVFEIFDTFAGMPSPTKIDGNKVAKRFEEISSGLSQGIGSNVYYGYEKDLLKTVRQNFDIFGISPEAESVFFLKGKFKDIMTINTPIAFAHIDCDWYESTRDAIQNIWPNISPGGIVIVDDYHYYQGCKIAIDEFLSNVDDYVRTEHPRLKLVKKFG